MAPTFPAEIDLFTIPHSRMKELVSTYTEKVQCVDFRDCRETFNLLKELQRTLNEFKSHEFIENLFIMDQLKNRLKQRHIYNSAVCDCHNDNRLAEMLNLVRHGKHFKKYSIGERLHFGEELQKSFTDFVQQFLPHMEEEENIFQPLLVEHFEYDELRALKEVVLEQHELIKDPLYQEKAELDLPETDPAIKDFRDLDSAIWSLRELYSEPWFYDNSLHRKKIIFKSSAPAVGIQASKEVSESSEDAAYYEPQITHLPADILIQIFGMLMPPDRGRCAQVCSLWNELVYTYSLWKEIYPIQWARGIWKLEDVNLNYTLEDCTANSSYVDARRAKFYDEDADIDETERTLDTTLHREYDLFESVILYLLPRIGKKVIGVILDAGRGITSHQIQRALMLCPDVSYLSAAYTSFDYFTLKKHWVSGCLRKLRYLDLHGCVNVDDSCLYLLAECLSPAKTPDEKCPVQFCVKNCQFRELHLRDEFACRFFSYIHDTSISCAPPSSESQNPSENMKKCPFWDSNDSHSTDPCQSKRDNEIEELHSASANKKYLLEYLNLSGCYEVTEQGLLFLLNRGAFQNLAYLNLSSCFSVSGMVLRSIVSQCRNLKPDNISYCNSITNGPYPSLANGCDNIYHPLMVCCQGRLNL